MSHSGCTTGIGWQQTANLVRCTSNSRSSDRLLGWSCVAHDAAAYRAPACHEAGGLQ